MKDEIEVKVKAVLAAAKVVAGMREPSVEKLLRKRGFEYEADQIRKLVEASDDLESSGTCAAGTLFKDGQTMRVVRPHEKISGTWWCAGVDTEVGLWAYSARFIESHLLTKQ